MEDRLRELSAQGDPLEQLQQIVDFELFRQVLSKAIKAGRTASEIWPDKRAKAAQKDTDARWVVVLAPVSTGHPA